MKLRVIIETVEDMLSAVAQRHSITTEQVKSTAVLISSKYWKWLLKLWYKGDINLYNLSLEKAGSIKDLMRRFNEAPKEGRDADINTFKSIDELERFLALVAQRQIDKFESGAEVLFKTNTYIIYSVSDAEVLKLIGEGTKWCTRGSYPDCAAYSYLYRHNHIFVITKDHKPFIQFTPDLAEIQWANNTRLNKIKLEEILSEMGADLDEILAKGAKEQLTANMNDDAKTLFRLITSVEQNTYNSQIEVPIATFLVASVTSITAPEFGIIFDHLVEALLKHGMRDFEIRNYKVETLFEGSAVKEDVARALNAIVDKICEFLANRPPQIQNRAYPSMREAILVLNQKNHPMVGKLAGAYDTCVGRHVESNDERRPIRQIAAESIDGIIELKYADGQRVPEGERRLLKDALNDVRYNLQTQEDGEVPWHTQSIDDLIDYYEMITHVANFDPNRPEALIVNRSVFNAFRWPEYEKILAVYPVYSPSHDAFKERLTTWLNSISSYLVINQITTRDVPRFHELTYNYLKQLGDMHAEDRTVFLNGSGDIALTDTLVNYVGLAADRNDARQIIELLNQYSEIIPEPTLRKLRSAAYTPDKISYSRFMTIR